MGVLTQLKQRGGYLLDNSPLTDVIEFKKLIIFSAFKSIKTENLN